jgi:hypothetical protein
MFAYLVCLSMLNQVLYLLFFQKGRMELRTG